MYKTFCIGLFRTGTNSMFEIFRRSFRAGHEFMKMETISAFRAHLFAEMTDEEFARFVSERVRNADLEMDASGLHAFYIDLLVREYPAAKMILTIRDCYSWLNSCIGVMLSADGQTFMGPFLNSIEVDPDGRFCWVDRTRCKISIGQLIRLWNALNMKMLASIAENQLLIVKLAALYQSMDRIAEFTGVSLEDLDYTHCNKSDAAFNYLAAFDQDVVSALFEEHASSMMNRFYKGFSYRDFSRNPNLVHDYDADRVKRVFSTGWEPAVELP